MEKSMANVEISREENFLMFSFRRDFQINAVGSTFSF